MTLQPIITQAAQITVDAASANTQLGQAGNGVPVINIATPNSNGLSHNKFTDYNVGKQGLILNNSTDKFTQTQLGGIISGNSQLQGKPAQIILNEVTGGQRSQLQGYTEVAGKQAHVIVANPNGITCDGCGFINTPRATLTTGNPIVEQGKLTGYNVQQGQIDITGAGLNASNISQFDLITRSAKVNAQIHANKLNIVTGVNTVDAQTLTAQAKTNAIDTDKPQLAIDSSALGGMYAGSIRLVGTEAGVGVKLAGDMAASSGDIQIDANGMLNLTNVSAKQNVNIKANEDVNIEKQVYAGNAFNLQTDAAINNKGNLLAANEVSLLAKTVVNDGAIAAGINTDNTRNTTGNITLAAKDVTNNGNVVASKNIDITAKNLLANNAKIVAEGNLKVESESINNKNSEFFSGNKLDIKTTQFDNTQGKVTAGIDAKITAKDILNESSGSISSGNTLHLDLQDGVLKNTNGQITAKNQTVIENAKLLSNQQGEVSAGNTLEITAKNIENTGSLVSESVASIHTQSIKNQGTVAANTDLKLVANTLSNNDGTLFSKGKLSLEAEKVSNEKGIIAAADLIVKASDSINNNQGLIESSNLLTVQSNNLQNNSGKIRDLGTVGNTVFELGGMLENNNGLIETANHNLILHSASLKNDNGRVLHLGKGTFTFGLDNVTDAGGELITQSDLVLTGDKWRNTSLLQAGNLTLNITNFEQGKTGKLLAQGFINGKGERWINDGVISSTAGITLDIANEYSGDGKLSTVGELKLSSNNLDLGTNAHISVNGKAIFAIAEKLSSKGKIISSDDLAIATAELINLGTLGSNNNVLIKTATLLNGKNSLIFSGNDLTIQADKFTNSYADIYSFGNIEITGYSKTSADYLKNLSSTIESEKNLTVLSDVIENRRDILTVNNTGKYYVSITELPCGSYPAGDCSGSRRNGIWQVTEREKLEVTESSAASNLLAKGNLALTGKQLLNASSLISSGGDLSFTFNEFSNLGIKPTNVEMVRVFRSGRKPDHGYYAGLVNSFNQKHGSTVQAGSVEGDLSAVIGSMEHEFAQAKKITQTPLAGEEYSGIVQAGGQIIITATETLENSVIRPILSYVGGGNRVDNGTTGNQFATYIPLGSQLAPDLSQKQVDPLNLPDFKVPTGSNGLFNVVTNTGGNKKHPYLIETNPALTDLRKFLSSDYIYEQLGLNSDEMQKRLGDGLYEQRLIRNALIARTGQRYLAGLTDDEAIFRYLMDNAIKSKNALNLALGVTLTNEQVAALTHDIVWMEEREVLGEKVLVPVLYLAQAQGRLASNGALIQGRDVALISGGNLNNQGTLKASNNLSALGVNIGNSGLIEANNQLQLIAEKTILNNLGGVITGKDVVLQTATGDIINETTVTNRVGQSGNNSWVNSYVHDTAKIEGANSLALNSGHDLINQGAVLKSGGSLALIAKQDVVITTTQDQQHIAKGSHFLNQSTTQQGSSIQASGDITILAGQDIAVAGSTISTDKNITLQAGNDVTLMSAANEVHSYGKGKKTTGQYDSVQQVSTNLLAGGKVVALSGNDLTLISSNIAANDEAYLVAGGKVQLLADQNFEYSFYEKKNKGSFGSNSLKSDEKTQVTHVGSRITTGGDLKIISGSDQRYQAAHLNSGNNLSIESGGAVVFEGVKDLEQESRKRHSTSAVWQSAQGKGHTDETLLQSQLIAQGQIAIKAAERIQIDVKEINQHSITQTIDAMVAADPQLAWLKEMDQRGDVDWRQVQEVHDSFKYKNEGLGGPAAIVIAIVVAYFTAGAASGAVASLGGGATAGGAAAGGAAAGATAAGTTAATTSAWAVGGWANAAATAAITSAASKTAISTINNKGNLGKGLKEATSKDSLKGYLTSAITAGFTSGYLDEAFGVKGDNINHITKGFDLSDPAGLAKFGTYLGAQGGVQALGQTVLNGGSLKDNLHNALTEQVYHLIQAGAFNAVGDISVANNWVDGSPEKIALHALVGGLLSEATGGDFRTGALAAGANEAITAQLTDELRALLKSDNGLESTVSQLVGVAVATATDGDLQKAADLAKNATAYNRQLHTAERIALEKQADKLAAEADISRTEALELLSGALVYYVDKDWRAVVENSGTNPLDDVTLKHLGLALQDIAYIYDEGRRNTWGDLINEDVPQAPDSRTKYYTAKETLKLLQNYSIANVSDFNNATKNTDLFSAWYRTGVAENDHTEFYRKYLDYRKYAEFKGLDNTEFAGIKQGQMEGVYQIAIQDRIDMVTHPKEAFEDLQALPHKLIYITTKEPGVVQEFKEQYDKKMALAFIKGLQGDSFESGRINAKETILAAGSLIPGKVKGGKGKPSTKHESDTSTANKHTGNDHQTTSPVVKGQHGSGSGVGHAVADYSDRYKLSPNGKFVNGPNGGVYSLVQGATHEGRVVFEASGGGYYKFVEGKKVPVKVMDFVTDHTYKPSRGQLADQNFGKTLPDSVRPQVSYKNGKEVVWGTDGSVRLDWTDLKTNMGFEVKDYDLTKSSRVNALINDVSKQVNTRNTHLPAGIKQNIVINTRGLPISDEVMRKITDNIAKKTNNIVTHDNIIFLKLTDN